MKTLDGDRIIHTGKEPERYRSRSKVEFDWKAASSKKIRKAVETRAVLADSYGGVYLKAKASPF